MRIARVTGTVTATVKNPQLAAHPLLIVDVIDAKRRLIQSSIVAVDTLGACIGETVLIVTGSAARIPADVSGIGVDATIVAIVDDISVNN